jgi:hypothetical protein
MRRRGGKSKPPRTDDLKARLGGGLGLADIVRHQAFETQFLHRGQVQPVYRATMNVSGVAVLPQRSRKQGSRESAKLVRLLVAEKGKPRFQQAPGRASQIPRQIIGLELDHHLEFRQSRDGYLALEADSPHNRGALRLGPKNLHQAA